MARKNKIIEKISEKTTGKKVDTVADFIDLFSQLVVEYFNTRYKISKKIEDIKRGVFNTLYAFKRAVVRTVIEVVLIITAILALVGGILILLSRYVPIEYVLIGYGIFIIVFLLFTMKVKE